MLKVSPVQRGEVLQMLLGGEGREAALDARVAGTVPEVQEIVRLLSAAGPQAHTCLQRPDGLDADARNHQLFQGRLRFWRKRL